MMSLSSNSSIKKFQKFSLYEFQEMLNRRFVDIDYLSFNFPKSTNYLVDGKNITYIFEYFHPQTLTLLHHSKINIASERERKECLIKLTNEQYDYISNFPMK